MFKKSVSIVFAVLFLLVSLASCKARTSGLTHYYTPENKHEYYERETEPAKEETYMLPVYLLMPEFDYFVNDVIKDFYITDRENKAFDSKSGMDCFNISQSATFYFTYEVINDIEFVKSFSVGIFDSTGSRQGPLNTEFGIGIDVAERLIDNLPNREKITYDTLKNRGIKEEKTSGSTKIMDIKEETTAIDTLVSFQTSYDGSIIYSAQINYEIHNLAEIEVDEETYQKYYPSIPSSEQGQGQSSNSGLNSDTDSRSSSRSSSNSSSSSSSDSGNNSGTAHQHSFLEHDGQPATCTEYGYSSYVTCECGYSNKTEIPPLGHDYVEADVQQPTCDGSGVITYKCTRCDDTYHETTPPTGHDFSKATCTAPKTCKICGKTEGDTLPHDMDHTKCKNCGYSDFSSIVMHSNSFVSDSWYSVDDHSNHLKDGQAELNIDKDGILTVTFGKFKYVVQLDQTEVHNYPNDGEEIKFVGYDERKIVEINVCFRMKKNMCEVSFSDYHQNLGQTYLCFKLK